MRKDECEIRIVSDVRDYALKAQPCFALVLPLLLDRLGEDHGLSKSMPVLSTTRFPETGLDQSTIAE